VPARYVRRFDFGAGVLVGRGDWMDGAPPYLAGGGAVRQVGLDATDWAASPARHEGGTPNVIGAVAVAAACRFIDSLPAGAVDAREGFLTDRLVAGLSAIDGVRTLRLWPASAPRPARAAALAGRRPGGPALALRRLGGVPWPACGEAPDEFFQRVEIGGA
jgi:selenocysteine lyase/cysteine desulfurase